MPFRFKQSDESVEAGLRRIACHEIDEALAVLRSTELLPERIVHEVRRRCKALRALIRLVRPVFPAFALENAAFRDIAAQLAGSRDSKVLVDTLDRLAARPDAALVAPAVARLRKRFEQGKGRGVPLRRTLDACAERLQAARVRAGVWTLNDDGWDALSDGFARTVRAARRAMKGLAATGSPELSHEWRKQVKYHWQHMRLLRAVAPGPAAERAKLALRLGDLLGERHDLDMFVERLAAQAKADDATGALLIERASKRAAKLHDKALKLGAELFAEKPRRLADKWDERWEAWARQEALA